MEICGHTGREYDTNNPATGCGCEIDLSDEDVMMVGAISFCVDCYENLSEADQEWVATEEETCQKCDEKVPLNPDNMWVQCTCSAHPGWYCGDHSPGNDCYSDEDCDCCNPKDECAQCHAKVVVLWVDKVGFTIGDCEGCGLMLCRKCLDNCQCPR
jgi:hypothetical protein